jgi:hypothetical protein
MVIRTADKIFWKTLRLKLSFIPRIFPLYDKRDDFNFAIVNFPFLSSNKPLSPAYGVYISLLIRYARACYVYENFSKRGQLMTKKLMLQGYNKSVLNNESFLKAIVH